MRPRISFRAPVNGFTGYGLHSARVVRDLEAEGIEVVVRPMSMDESIAPLPEMMRERFIFEEDEGDWELLLTPPHARVAEGKRTIYSTMWEASRLQPKQVELLNEAECVIVPCAWNEQMFRESGVSRPIYRVPLGVDTEVFQYAPMSMRGPCIFGAAGRLQSGEERKRVGDVIQHFLAAFPTEQDVRLHVKLFPDCDLAVPNDPRICVTREYMEEHELAAWFGRLTCFVSAARAEGWGCMQNQALAIGRPLISARFGGVAEYFEPEMGYAVPYDLVDCEGQFAGYGQWAAPDPEAIVAAMRQVYQDREEAREKGRLGARGAGKFSWEQSNRKLLQTLQAVGAIPLKKQRALGRKRSKSVEEALVAC